MRRLIAAGAATLALLGGGAPAHAQGADTTCVLPLTKTDPATVNVAYPDEAAIYWITGYQAAPGARLRITGRYPHARYSSFNVYDQAQRPLDALADVEIGPDPGSANPFAAGADRTGAKRDYTAYVDFGAIPAKRAPNTLYTGTGQNGAPNVNGTLILRVYVPDKGRDETGGVGLPTVTLEPAGASGSRPADSPCANASKPPVAGVNEGIAGASSPPAPEGAATSGLNPPRWIKFRNLVQVANYAATGNPFLDDFGAAGEAAEPAGGNGAFLANIHNSYVYAAINRGYGEVSVTRVRAPSFPDTRPAPARMPAAQLRYFSLCTNDFASQRFIACVTDDRSVVGADGFVHYVVSSAASRPAWANAACGYTWLPFGPNMTSSLILRHMLPEAGFAQAIQRAEPRKEAATMGDYLPATRYLKAGEVPACRAPRTTSGPSLGLPSSNAPRACRSRRAFTIHLSRRLRSAVVTVAGRRVRVRHLRAPVRLGGLPRGTYQVRITGRTRAGRRVTSVRTYRTCAVRGGGARRPR